MLKGLILQFQWSIKRALCSLFLILSFLTIFFFLVSGSLFGVFIVFFVCHLQLLLFETLFQLSPSFSLISIDNYNNNNNILVIIFFFPVLTRDLVYIPCDFSLLRTCLRILYCIYSPRKTFHFKFCHWLFELLATHIGSDDKVGIYY